METLQDHVDRLNNPNFKEMHGNDLFLTWEKTDRELEAMWAAADALCFMRKSNISTEVFESGFGISLFRDNSICTRFFFTSVCNLLGLEVQDLDGGRNQVARGETARETANVISFTTDIVGIRDDIYIGKSNIYMHEIVNAVTRGHKDGILERKPTLVNLQRNIDHLTQCMADILHIVHEFGGAESLGGKKLVTAWAYSPSYGKSLSVPQGVVGLTTRMGTEAILAHPEGCEIIPEVREVTRKNTEKTGGPFRASCDMADAFKDADTVYPKSWASFAAIEKGTDLYIEGDYGGIKALEEGLLAQNAGHKDWCCTEELMKTAKDNKALYLHCLSIDINDVGCKGSETEAAIFNRYRDPLYKEVSYKPYVTAVMIMLAKFANPADVLKRLEEKGIPRVFK